MDPIVINSEPSSASIWLSDKPSGSRRAILSSAVGGKIFQEYVPNTNYQLDELEYPSQDTFWLNLVTDALDAVVPSSGAPRLTTALRTSCGIRR